MALFKQKQVIAALDLLAGRAMARVARRYREKTIGPMVTAIRKAKSPAGLLQRLSGGLLRKMDSTAVENAVADTQVQSGLIGRVTAEPRKK